MELKYDEVYRDLMEAVTALEDLATFPLQSKEIVREVALLRDRVMQLRAACIQKLAVDAATDLVRVALPESEAKHPVHWSGLGVVGDWQWTALVKHPATGRVLDVRGVKLPIVTRVTLNHPKVR